MGDNRDEDWPLAPEPVGEGPPPDEYTLAYKHGRIVPNRFGRRVAEIAFRIADQGKWLNTVVVMYCAIPKDRSASLRSKYYRMWVLANGGRPPTRGDRMTPRSFEGGYWLGKIVRTKQTTDGEGVRDLKDGETGVSVVECLIKRIAGSKVTAARANAASVLANGIPLHEMIGAEKR